MLNPTIVAVSAGAAVAAVGLLMIRSHRRVWGDQKNDPGLEDSERAHFHRRYRRRMQASGTVVLLGALLALGGGAIPWVQLPPLAFDIYWGGVLLLTAWVIVQALGDMLSTGAHAKASLSQVRAKQRELERQLEDYKSRRGNGRHTEE